MMPPILPASQDIFSAAMAFLPLQEAILTLQTMFEYRLGDPRRLSLSSWRRWQQPTSQAAEWMFRSCSQGRPLLDERLHLDIPIVDLGALGLQRDLATRQRHKHL